MYWLGVNETITEVKYELIVMIMVNKTIIQVKEEINILIMIYDHILGSKPELWVLDKIGINHLWKVLRWFDKWG